MLGLWKALLGYYWRLRRGRWSRLWCKHVWRYNTMEFPGAIPSGLWRRYCCHCGQWQQRSFEDKQFRWRNWNK